MPTKFENRLQRQREKTTVIAGTNFYAPHLNPATYMLSELSRTYRFDFVSNIDITGPVFPFPNWQLGAGSPNEAAGANLINVQAAIWNGFQLRPLNFGGKPTIDIYPGATVRNDKSNLQIYAGTTNSLLVMPTVGTLGMTWPFGGPCTFSETGNFLTNRTGINDATTPAYSPLDMTGLINGTRTKATVLVLGDSLTLSGGAATAYASYYKRMFDTMGVMCNFISIGGQTVAGMLNTGNAYAMTSALESEADIIILAIAGNTLIGKILANTVTTVDQCIAELQPMIDRYVKAGRRVFVPTLTTYVGSPSFTTAQKTLRADFNQAARDGKLKGVERILDIGALCETALGNNVPRSGFMIGDGVHFTDLGHTTIASDAVPLYSNWFNL